LIFYRGQQRAEIASVEGDLLAVRGTQAIFARDEHPADDCLRDRRGVHGDHALDRGELVGQQASVPRGADDRLVRDQEAHPGAGKHRLGERAEVDHLAVSVQRLQRRVVPVVNAEEPVRVVFQDQEVFVARHGEQFAPHIGTQRDPGRVREVRDHVQRPRPPAAGAHLADDAGDGFRAEALRRLGHGDHGDAEHPRGTGEANVARLCGQDDVLRRRAEPAQRDDHCFLAARGHHDRLGGNPDVLIDFQHPRDHRPELAVCPAVLQDGLPDARLDHARGAQVADINGQVPFNVLDGIELIEWPAGGQRYSFRKAAGDFIEEVHRRRHGISYRRMQRLAH
jgi:hypothetical protein